MKAKHYKKLKNNTCLCEICNNYCVLKEGETGKCFSRKNIKGELEVLNYGKISSIAIDPIEKKPLYHFYPFSQVLSLGTYGCNFACKHCQNWTISQQNELDGAKELTPSEVINLAKKYDSKGIAITYNEPTIWYEFMLDVFKLAKENNLYTVMVTNGYITTKALDELCPYLDAFRVDVKGFSDKFYQELAGIKNFEKILESTLFAKDKGCHIECVTNIIPTLNDDDKTFEDISKWIFENLGELTAWHITRFYPCYELNNLPITPIETLDRAKEIGLKNGLKFIYQGNIGKFEQTQCPDCNEIVIDRKKQKTALSKEGKCNFCGFDLKIPL